jgi:hypothetical protein
MPVANSLTVATNSTSVTTTSTAPLVGAPGDILYAAGYIAPILAITGFDTLTLALPWRGPPLTEVVDWKILTFGEYWRSTITVNQNITDIIKRLDAGLPFAVQAWLTPAQGGDRSSYDDRPVGFIIGRTDTSPYQISVKVGTGATWAAWSSLRGLQGDAAASTTAAELAKTLAEESALDAQLAESAATARAAEAAIAAGSAVNARDAALGAQAGVAANATAAAGSAADALAYRNTTLAARDTTTGARDTTLTARDATLAARDVATGAATTATTKAAEAVAARDDMIVPNLQTATAIATMAALYVATFG